MVILSSEAVWQLTKKRFLELLDEGKIAKKERTLNFYAPSFMYYKSDYYKSKPNQFPTISITGSSCSLNCKHCEGKILETMQPATTPDKLYQVCQRLKKKGAIGCLVSGGSQINGSVPLKDFIPTLERIKRDMDLNIHVHTGIIDVPTAKALKHSGVDAALIDIVGSDETIKNILNLNATAEDYATSLRNLHESGIPFIPHVIVGLHDGLMKGEFQALKMIAPHDPPALVIIAFMPVRGTSMAATKPPQPVDIARVIATARVMFPKTPLALGCMRPKGRHRSESDILAIKAGVSAIAFPHQEGVEYATSEGYKVNFSSYCCSEIYKDLKA
jgi:lipoyl synthase